MAVVVSIARGHDASYPFKAIGAADGATITGERGAGYYLSAVEKGGEPVGTWVGNSAAELVIGLLVVSSCGRGKGAVPLRADRGRASCRDPGRPPGGG